MRNVQNRSRIKFAIVAGLATCTAIGAAAHDADAAYSGFITRSVCMAGTMVPRNPDRNFWDNSFNTTCSAKVIDSGSSTAFHWARVSIPVERKTTPATLSGTVRVNGGGSGNGQVCAQLWLSDASGNITTGANDCSVNPFGFKTLTPAALTLPVDGAALLDIAAQNSGEAHVLSLSWIANGT
jgi:hypothetical protein